MQIGHRVNLKACIFHFRVKYHCEVHDTNKQLNTARVRGFSDSPLSI